MLAFAFEKRCPAASGAHLLHPDAARRLSGQLSRGSWRGWPGARTCAGGGGCDGGMVVVGHCHGVGTGGLAAAALWSAKAFSGVNVPLFQSSVPGWL